jgi:hypothetical protein
MKRKKGWRFFIWTPLGLRQEQFQLEDKFLPTQGE